MKGKDRGGENEKAAQDEVVMVMVWVCSGPRRMRIERMRENKKGRKRKGIAALLVIPDDCFHSSRTKESRP